MKQDLEADYLAAFKKTVAQHEGFLKRLVSHKLLKLVGLNLCGIYYRLGLPAWECYLGCSPQSSRAAHIPHVTSQDLVKNTSLGGGLPVLQIKIPFGIHLLGS